jgi:hypothetical protein
MNETSTQPARAALHRIATTFDRDGPPASPLADVDIDILQHAHDEHAAFARDAETHRSTIMTFVITGVGAVVYALAALKFDPRYWPVPLIAAALAAYAAVVVNIYHERWEFFMMIARGFRWRIAAARPSTRLEEIRAAAKAAHKEQFKTQRRLYVFWYWLAVAISVTGVACAAAMIVVLLRA